jgi:Tol biopolymer transport system component
MNNKLNSMVILIAFFFISIVVNVHCQKKNITIDYFGQTPPDTIPKIFAPGIICLDNRFEGRGYFSPDGKSYYFTITSADYSSPKILFTEYINNKWTQPDTAVFSKSFSNHEPFISSDGQRLYFTSDRDKKTAENRRDLFYVNKLKNGWSEPVKLDVPINSGYTEFFFYQSNNGTIYFASNRPGGFGMLDIYYVKPENGKYDKLINIGNVINKGYTGDPCIAPDDSYIIFTSARKIGADNCDLYISFNKNGNWSEPIDMGNLINTKANEYGPCISPDGKYLFFVRHDGKKGDIYWIDASIVDKFRNK